MDVELQFAQSTTDVFMHGFSAGMAFALVLYGLHGIYRNWRRDP